MKHFVILFLILGMPLSLHALDPGKTMNQYVRDTWGSNEGLPNSVITAITQTKDGYLWVGTPSGSVRFDGVRFKTFDKNNTPAIISSYVLCLLQNREGALWIGTLEGGLTRLKDGVFQHYGTVDGLSNETVDTLLEDQKGNLWIGTDAGLDVMKDGKISLAFPKEVLPDDRINSLCEDQAGNIWVATHNKGLFRIQNGEIKNYTTADGLNENRIWKVYSDHGGSIWAGTEDGGFNRFQNGKWEGFTAKDGLPNNIVTWFQEDRDGNMWLATYGGLSRFRDGKFTSFAMKDGLPHDTVWAIHEDREGNLWVGTEGGLSRFHDGIFAAFSVEEGLSDRDARTVIEGSDGSIWVGTRAGLNRLKNGRITVYTDKDGLSANRIASLWIDHKGALWVGTRGEGGGLNRFDGEKFIAYTVKDGLPDDHVFVIYEDRDLNLWVAPADSGLSLFQDGKFKTYTTADGLSSDTVGFVRQDRSGNLWVGTDGGGLNLFRNGSFRSFTTKDGLSNERLSNLWEDEEGTLWIATSDGVNRFQDGKFTVYKIKDGLPEDNVNAILEDGKGNFWMSCARGIFRVRKKDLNDFADGRIHSIPSVLFGIPDGMKSRECSGGEPAGWRSKDGRLWFPTQEGVVVVDPERLHKNELYPVVLVEEARVDGQVFPRPVAESQSPILQPGSEKLEFDYTATSLVVPERVKFQYKLDGYDKDWVDVGTRRTAYYTHIPPGEYVFRVKACNNDGVWNEAGASLAFVLQPHFYQTRWFYALCVLGFLASVAGAYRFRVRQLKAREEQLESLVQERTGELEAAMQTVQDQASEIRKTSEKLRDAQERIQRMADSSPQALENVNVWSKQAAVELARILGAEEIGIWTLEQDKLVPLVKGEAALPSVPELRGQSDIVVSGGQTRLPVKGMTGETYGVVIVSGGLPATDETARRLLAGFANQLGGMLEMLILRKRLSEAEERRLAVRKDMKERGIVLVQVCSRCSKCYDDTVTACADDQSLLDKSFLVPYRIENRYRLIRLLGRGGMGVVFLSQDETLKRPVSVKVILAELMSDPLMKIRMKREALLIAQIQHPGIVSIYDFGELPDASAYILMEFLKGLDLAKLLMRQGPGTPQQVAMVLRQTSDALTATHRVGVIHRDLKPPNLFLIPGDTGFQVKVLDFGLAKSIVTEDVSLTASGLLIGTPSYMPPEQIRGETVTQQSDLFSLASVAYELLTGKPAFDAINVPDIITKILSGDLPSLMEKFKGASPELDRVFQSALAVDREKRPASVSAWAEQMSDLLMHVPAHVPGWNLNELPI